MGVKKRGEREKVSKMERGRVNSDRGQKEG